MDGQYHEGRLVGEFQKWHENGRLAGRKLYSEAGQLTAEYSWTAGGVLVYSWPEA